MLGKRILLVDDAAIMRMTIKNILVKNGFTICGEGRDGYEAIEKYRALKPDLVIMDTAMPKMDGLTSLKKIIKEFPDAKIIMSSAAGEDSCVLDAKKSGAADFIFKPFHADKIISAVTGILKVK